MMAKRIKPVAPPIPPDDPVELLEAQMKLDVKQAQSLCLEHVQKQHNNNRLRVWYDSDAVQLQRFTCRICGRIVIETTDDKQVKNALDRHVMMHGVQLFRLKGKAP